VPKPSSTSASIVDGTTLSSMSACRTAPRRSAFSRRSLFMILTSSLFSTLLTPATRSASFAASRFCRKVDTVPRSVTMPSSAVTPIALASTFGSQPSSSVTLRSKS